MRASRLVRARLRTALPSPSALLPRSCLRSPARSQWFGVIGMASLVGAVPGKEEDAGKSWVAEHLQWMRAKKIWPEGYRVRYLWTDGLGVVLLLSMWQATGEARYLEEAKAVTEDVYAKLGDARCMRIGLEPRDDRYPFSYAHYNAVWLYALYCLAQVDPSYRQRAIDMVKASHSCFIVKGRGIWWKIYADGSGPEPGRGFGGLDHYKLYVMYRLLDPGRTVLGSEIADVEELVMKDYRRFDCSQDLGLGMILWAAHFFPEEAWARTVAARCLDRLEEMWVDKGAHGGYFARAPWARNVLVVFANCGVGMGLQAALSTSLVPPGQAGAWHARIARMHSYLEKHVGDDDEYAEKAITWVMLCNSRFPGWLCVGNVPRLADAGAKAVPATTSTSMPSMSSGAPSAPAGGVDAAYASAMGKLAGAVTRQPAQPGVTSASGHK